MRVTLVAGCDGQVPGEPRHYHAAVLYRPCVWQSAWRFSAVVYPPSTCLPLSSQRTEGIPGADATMVESSKLTASQPSVAVEIAATMLTVLKIQQQVSLIVVQTLCAMVMYASPSN